MSYICGGNWSFLKLENLVEKIITTSVNKNPTLEEMKVDLETHA